MSKKEERSKYLPLFYSEQQPQTKPESSQNIHGSVPPKPLSHDSEKFKNPADFFKSTQSLPSQGPNLSQIRPRQHVKSSQTQRQLDNKTSFGGGGSTHEMLSQSFQAKKPVMRPMLSTPIAKPPMTSFIKPFSHTSQRKPFIGLDENVASTKALELQWTTKMRQAKKAELEAQKMQNAGNLEKRNSARSDSGKSPMGKSFWADVSFTKTDAACKNQQNDPWYSNDVWGDDLSIEAVDECLRVASTQEAKRSIEQFGLDDALSSWMDESWASPEKVPSQSQHQAKPGVTTAKMALFTDKPQEKTDEFVDLLSGDPAFLALLDSVESQQKKVSLSSSDMPKGSSLSLGNVPKRPFGSEACSTSSQNSFSRSHVLQKTSALRPTFSRKSVPLSERMPVSNVSGDRSSFIIKAKEFESPSKNEGLSLSQRKLQKPTKSLPSPSTQTSKYQTEWLRGQLEKISSEYSTLKEDVQVKDGESKLLREKLKSAEEEVKKHKLLKTKELETLREAFEKKVKLLEKQLEATQVQAIFKAKEAESSLEKYRELKSMFVLGPEFPASGPSFKGLSLTGARPGESAKVLADATASTHEIIDETMEVMLTPTKVVEELAIEETPEKCMFDDSPIKVDVDDEQTAPVERPFVVEKLVQSSLKKQVFGDGFVKRNSILINAADQIVHGVQPRKELNHFLRYPMEYLPHMLLQTEFSEQEVENYPVRRPTLVELWGTSYNAFGDAVLDDYEKAQVGDFVPLDPAKNILSHSIHFSTLDSVHEHLITLSNKSQWGLSERTMSKNVVDLAMSMTRELFATLGDPRLLRTTYTIYDRDPKVLNDFQDCSELIDMFDPLSPNQWKNESFVELRRCLVFVGLLCSMDHMTTRYIINPRTYKTGRTQEFYPPNTEHCHNSIRRSNNDKDLIFKLVVNEGERKPNELKLMQMYRDLHSKKLTIVSELASAIVPKCYKVCQPLKAGKIGSSEDMDTETVGSSLKMYNVGCSTEMALKEALESSENIAEFRTEVTVEPQLSPHIENIPSYDEYKDCIRELNLKLDFVNVHDFVVKLEGVLNPKKISLMKELAVEPETRQSILETDVTRDWVTVPTSFVEASDSEILKFDLENNSNVLCAPVNRCITNLERNMMRNALVCIDELKSRICGAIANDVQSDLDFTRYVHSCNDADVEVSRKRKMSIDDIDEPRKTMKVAEYHTPEFDKSLYSQIQRKDNEDHEVVILETQTQPLSPTEDDQVAKFEKREEMAELKRKMLAEEKETKHNQPSSRHSFAPVRLPGRHSPSCEESASREAFMEIEQMFQSQAKPEAVDEPVMSSDESDDESDETIKTLSAEHGNDIEIEFIPELVKKFHHKLRNAGLLELLCEVFKEGGVLRYTYRLNGVMLGTLLMLQKLVMYQKKEVEPYCSKMATIIREILYARPSPRIVLEVNVFLSHAISIEGFTKMLCHNASQETFVIRPDQVYFTRGACLLEVVCILVTYATDDDTDVQIYFELSHWVYHIICSQNKHMACLYEQHYAKRRRCMCITALNNTMIMIYHRALSLYRGQTATCSGGLPKRQVLEKIFLSGLQVLRMMYTFGPFNFLFSIKTQHSEFRQFLLWLREMHESDLLYEGFSLSTANLFTVTELLKDNRDPNPTPKRSPEMTRSLNLENFFRPGNQWPYDFNNSDSLVKTDSSESEED